MLFSRNGQEFVNLWHTDFSCNWICWCCETCTTLWTQLLHMLPFRVSIVMWEANDTENNIFTSLGHWAWSLASQRNLSFFEIMCSSQMFQAWHTADQENSSATVDHSVSLNPLCVMGAMIALTEVMSLIAVSYLFTFGSFMSLSAVTWCWNIL